MHTVNNVRRVLGLICLSLLLISGMGCNKLLAKYSLSRANKRVEESKSNDASKFTRDLLDKTQQQVNKATSEYERQSFADAKITAQEAATQSKDLLDRTIFLRATFLKEQAYKWIDIARLNSGQQENAGLFTKIQADNEDGLKRMEKQKYYKSIEIFNGVYDDTRYLLKNLEAKAKDGLVETTQMRDDLIKEGAKEHAPEYVTKLEQFMDQIKSYNNKEYNYRASLSTRDKARQVKQEGIQETKRVKSEKQIREIENLLETATSLGAEIYALQNFRSVTKEFENMLTQFYEKNYDTVLASTPQLKPRVERLIIETKRESARAKKNAVEQSINSLVDKKARNYLPGRVEQLEAILNESNQLFKAEKFTDSQKVSERGLELNQSIIQEFDSLAQKEINKASESLATGEGVYNTMKEIFDKPAPGELTGEDKTLETSKHAMKEELRARLNNARLSLGVATLKREGKEFDVAIETAKQVGQTSEDVTQQTYRVVAHNAILEIASQLTRFEREGGRQYAAPETDKTLKLLEQSKDLLHAGQYRDAVRKTADTKAQLAILTQELERVAVKRIESAQKALSQAKDNKAERYQNDTFTQAIVSLDRAKASLEGAGLQQAIESARTAEDLADSASVKSLQQWGGEQMRRADLLLAQARQAGADHYAPETLQKANELRKNLQQLYDQKSYQQAINVGEQTVEASDAALYAKVIEAENDIATAKRNDGWRHQPQRLAQAIVSAKSARELTDKGDYNQALQSAQTAITMASGVAQDAKRQGFESRMATLQKQLATAQKEGAGYYQSKDLSKILSEMNRLGNEFNGKSYEDLAQQAELLESQLAGVMEMTPDVLKDLVASMQSRMQELDTRGARRYQSAKVDEVENKIKFAQLDYKNNKFRPSFENAKDASRLLDAIELNLDEHEFDTALNKEMKAFSDQVQKFGPVLNLGSPAVVDMVIGPQGKAQALNMVQAIAPSDLRTNITEIGARVQGLKTPRTRLEVRDAALKMLMQAKTGAANFEKMLILDQFSPKEAREIIQTAFLQIYQARTQQQDIQHALRFPQSDLQPKGVERIITAQGR